MDYFQNKYRIPSARLRDWDYGSAALYFITLCTQHRQPCFGAVAAGAIQRSPLGDVAQEEWIKTLEIRPDMHLHLGAFVVMPNHFHAIIGIGENPYNTRGDIRGDTGGDIRRDAMHRVSTNPNPNLPEPAANQFGPQSKNLASIVRGYKSAVTMAARKMQLEFAWQARFHDHIIRNEAAARRITEYFLNNPARWRTDDFFQ